MIEQGVVITTTIAYTYDGLSRLSAAAYSDGPSFTYEYDGAGDLLSFSRWNGSEVETVNFVYNGANQIECLDGDGNGLCGDPQDIPYTYDRYGNLTSDGVKTYEYDAANRLISVNDGVSTTTYAYSGDGDRVSQTVDGVTTTYVIDVAAPLTMVLAEKTGTDTIYYLHGLDLLAQHDGTTTEYFTYDGLGSVRQVVDSAGELLYGQGFDPYGNLYLSAGDDKPSWGFTGEQTDSNGLIFLRARYYHVGQGRFLTMDPWKGDQQRPMSLNPWVYGYSNPVRFSDPSGLIIEDEAPRAEYIVQDLMNVYNVKIKKDWGWRYLIPVFPDTYFLNPCTMYWQSGHWNSIHELDLVETAIIATAIKMGGPGKFKSAFGGRVISITRVPINILFSGMAPPYIYPLTGDIVISDLAFTSDIFAKYTVAHELAHVWDWQTGMRLSKGMADFLQNWTCVSGYGGGACFWDPTNNPEPPPHDPRARYAYTNYMEDWADSFGTYIYPQYFAQRPENIGLGPSRMHYIESQIQNLP